MHTRTDIWRKSLRLAGWFLLVTVTFSLLVAAMNVGSSGRCAGLKISYDSGEEGTYVGTGEVLKWLGIASPASVQDKTIGELDLRAMERRMEREPWVRDAELYIDRNRILHIHLQEREPVARIFTTEGLTFFIDSSMGMIPVNPSHTPRVIVFTGLPVGGRAWKRRDSLVMSEVREIALRIASDSLMSALVEQVDLDPVKGFVMVPKVGGHSIVMGEGKDIEDKVRRLKIFHQQVLSLTGWSMYREVDLRFRGQVVAIPTHPATVERPASGAVADSVKSRTPVAANGASARPGQKTVKTDSGVKKAPPKSVNTTRPKAVMSAKSR
jgi:cell division protein FtsQ